MILKSLSLKNFRNYQEKEFIFSPQTTLVVGANASGKTNLLEAICLLSSGHSFRGGKDDQMIKYQCQISNAKCQIDSEKLEIILTIGEVEQVKTPKKRYLVNGVAKRAMDFIGILRVVVFRPEDLEIVIDSPATRRDYLDSVLAPVDRDYRRSLLTYKKGLRQRNKLLEQIRDGKQNRASLYFWDKLLIGNGDVLTRKRSDFIDFINSQPDYFESLETEYDSSTISPQRLAQYEHEEVAAGMTLVGPHRDDFKVKSKVKSPKFRPKADHPVNEKVDQSRDLAIYGSRGEQRLAVFSLKLAELEFVTQKTRERPVLLLDDIFSELDEFNRQRLLEVIPKQQTIITTTEMETVDQKFLQNMEKIKL